MAVMALVGTALVAGGQAAEAGGGGVCEGPATDQATTKVEISGVCFGPTVARVPVGGKVTWTNLDPFAHNVVGASVAWGGYDDLRPNGSATYDFPKAGVYPYACTIHPGMVGTVVVGSAAAIAPRGTPDAPTAQARSASATGAGSDLGWRLGTFAGFGLLAATSLRRRLRRREGRRTT
jgi:plastocyanin